MRIDELCQMITESDIGPVGKLLATQKLRQLDKAAYELAERLDELAQFESPSTDERTLLRQLRVGDALRKFKEIVG